MPKSPSSFVFSKGQSFWKVLCSHRLISHNHFLLLHWKIKKWERCKHKILYTKFLDLCGLFQQEFSKVGKPGYLLKLWQNKRSPSNFVRALICKLTKVFINLKIIVMLHQQNVWKPTSRVKFSWKCCQVLGLCGLSRSSLCRINLSWTKAVLNQK